MEALVALFAILCVFGLPIVALIVTRVLAHRERMEMIRQGMLPYDASRADYRSAALRGRRQDGAPRCDTTGLERGIRLTMIGLALFIGLAFIGYSPHHDAVGMEFRPGPWLLGGLIPMFVGISQVIVARLQGARFGPAAGSEPTVAVHVVDPPSGAQPVSGTLTRMRPPSERGPESL